MLFENLQPFGLVRRCNLRTTILLFFILLSLRCHTNYRQPGAGDYIVAAGASSPDGDVTGNIGGMDGWIFKLSNSGALEWQKNCSGISYDEVRSMVSLGNNSYLLAGYAESNDNGIMADDI